MLAKIKINMIKNKESLIFLLRFQEFWKRHFLAKTQGTQSFTRYLIRLICDISTKNSLIPQILIPLVPFFGRSGSASSSAVGLSAISLLFPLSLLSQRMPLQSLTLFIKSQNLKNSEVLRFRDSDSSRSLSLSKRRTLHCVFDRLRHRHLNSWYPDKKMRKTRF